MKIERLIKIILVLLQNKKVTATFLANKFDVSSRTIYRDITDLCLAGIPVLTMAGNDGGIMIDENYKIDKTIFSKNELQAIFSGLLSLDSVSQDNKYQDIIDKFLSKNTNYTNNPFLINLSSHYKTSLSPKITDIQEAIETLHQISFDYFNGNGKHTIVLEPYFIVFQWSSWYVFGYDIALHDFRLYKLQRLWNIKINQEQFSLQEIPPQKLVFDSYFTNEIKAHILFDPSVKHLLIEEYGIDSYTTLDTGLLSFTFPFTNKEYLISWVLSFGDKAKLIEPTSLQVEIKQRLENAIKKYP